MVLRGATTNSAFLLKAPATAAGIQVHPKATSHESRPSLIRPHFATSPFASESRRASPFPETPTSPCSPATTLHAPTAHHPAGRLTRKKKVRLPFPEAALQIPKDTRLIRGPRTRPSGPDTLRAISRGNRHHDGHHHAPSDRHDRRVRRHRHGLRRIRRHHPERALREDALRSRSTDDRRKACR